MKRSLGMLAAAFAVIVITAHTETSDGKDVFEKRCGGCHSLDHEKEGPRLGGVYGRAAGSVASFNYSDALKNSHITWDADTLDKWLAGPDKVVPETDMAFHVESASERRTIIAYLKEMR
jgi:cytochrome c